MKQKTNLLSFLNQKILKIFLSKCKNKNLKELKNIYNFLPNYWEKLRALQQKIDISFRKKNNF